MIIGRVLTDGRMTGRIKCAPPHQASDELCLLCTIIILSIDVEFVRAPPATQYGGMVSMSGSLDMNLCTLLCAGTT